MVKIYNAIRFWYLKRKCKKNFLKIEKQAEIVITEFMTNLANEIVRRYGTKIQ